MNPFLGWLESGEDVFLPRLYGRVDQFTAEGERWDFLFDTVGADFFDAAETPHSLRDAWFDRPPLRIVEMTTRPDRRLLTAIWQNGEKAQAENEESPWLELRLSRTSVEDSRFATIYDSILGAGEKVFVTSIERAKSAEERLEATFTLDSVEDATEGQLVGALPATGHADFVAVYDVGQGSCNAICSQNVPMLYFDFGGGILQNRFTFPSQLQRWCFTNQPPVVLSHWDWDHWSSEARDPRVRNTTWIAPRQTIGPTHAAFAASLSQLLLWPASLTSMTQGAVTLERCTGSGRNHSGLALIVHNGSQRILLPGDARYTAIPSSAGSAKFSGIVAPHHGADMRSAHVPHCLAGCANARLAYSFGAGNTFAHPRSITQTQHHAAGWQHVPPGPPPSQVLTTDVRRNRFGHLSLHWTPQSGPPPLPCGGQQCDLEIEQV